MSNLSHKTLLPHSIYEYLLQHSLRQPDALKALYDKTLSMPEAGMMSAPEEAQLLALLARLMQAKSIIEVGVFTGYTTLVLALTLPANGKLIACDVSTEFTDIGNPFWKQAGVSDKIDLRIAPALETLEALLKDGYAEQVDLIFIDADKANYPAYYEKSLQLIKPQGLIAIDNTLGITDAHVCQENLTPRQQKTIDQIKHFNAQLAKDQRVDISMLPIAQGLTLVIKKIGITSFSWSH